jgi:diaminohydroxyphosphoribosylaminopyrimidine deaminase/5-amino-6-(5-phosphoribosylamino)uracil reductase
MVDRIIFFVAPKLLGGREAVPVLGGIGVHSLHRAVPVSEWQARRVGDDLMIEGRLSRPPLSWEGLSR